MNNNIVILSENTVEKCTSEEWCVSFYLCKCGNHKIRIEHNFCFKCGAILDKTNIKR